jgi:hypothetical protein
MALLFFQKTIFTPLYGLNCSHRVGFFIIHLHNKWKKYYVHRRFSWKCGEVWSSEINVIYKCIDNGVWLWNGLLTKSD